MILQWRDDEYEFQPMTLQGGGDKINRNNNIDLLIFGADTESVHCSDRYEMQCYTLSTPRRDHLEYVPARAFGLSYLLEEIHRNYKAELTDAGGAFLYFHNLAYDWLQLIKTNPALLEMATIGVSPEDDITCFDLADGSNVIMKKRGLFTGSAPHFTIRIKSSKKNYYDIHFRDSFSFFPGSLKRVAKELNLDEEKDERQEDLGLKDWRDCGESEGKTYFESYARKDARITRYIGEQVRTLHQYAGLLKMRASAPSFAIALLFQQMDQTQFLTTGPDDPAIMQLILDTYRGGRTGGLYHGKIEDLSIYDFHSSYPASMTSLPSFSPSCKYIRPHRMDLEYILSMLAEDGNAFLRVSGIETDAEYPALITSVKGKLTPIYGAFQNIATTGHELYAGIRSGGLKDIIIHDCVMVLDMQEDPALPFRNFARAAYERKANSKKGSVEYIAAKLTLNGAYGKLIESRDQTFISAAEHFHYLPFLEGMEKEFSNYYFLKYIDAIQAGSSLSAQWQTICNEVYDAFGDDQDWMQKAFGDFSLSGKIYGRYAIPAAASLITAISRTRLYCAIKATGALYWDTDSIFLQGQSTEQVSAALLKTDEWIPANVQRLRIGDDLGDLDQEVTGATGYLAGIKRYYFETDGKVKAATHGLPALPKEDTMRIIRELATGNDAGYHSKAKPLKAKEAGSVERIGAFESKDYLSSFELDPRLNWTRTDSGWVGQVRNFITQGVKEMQENERTAAKYDQQMKKLFSFDPLYEHIQNHGFLRIPGKDSRFYPEYQKISNHVKRKYFRKSNGALALDDFAHHVLQIDTNELIQQLIERG